MNDEFNMLRPSGDEPEQPDDTPDWLSALDSGAPDSGDSAADDLPPAQADDPLGWLEQYSAPPEGEEASPEAESDSSPDWLQRDELFAPSPGGSDEADWTNKPNLFDASTDPTAESSPTDDMPPWLTEGAKDESAAVSDTDLFAGLDEALGIAPAVPQTDSPVSAVPDWLQAQSPEPIAEPDTDDLFAQFDAPPSPAASAQPADDQAAVPAEDDFLRNLKLTDTGSAQWFTEPEQPSASLEEAPDWLQQLGDSPEPAEAPAAPAPASAPSNVVGEDFMAELFGDSNAEPSFSQKSGGFDITSFDAPGLQDIDSLLASYDNAPALEQTDNTNLTEADLDRLLSDEDVEEISARRSTGTGTHEAIPGLSPDAPDWLAELGASVGSVDEVSAAAMVRKQTQNERSVDELSDRLFALHEAGQELPEQTDSGSASVIKNLLPGVDQVISAAPLKTGLPGMTGEVALNDEQRSKINLLKSLVAVEEEKPRAQRPAAIDLTLDSPNLQDLAEPDLGLAEKAPEVEVAPVAIPRRRARVKIDRLLISLLVAAAVILPFVVAQLRIGALPPPQFSAGSRQQAVYDRVNALSSGQLVLVAAEYGPTGAAELDSALDAILRHILMRGARPVLVSGNPVGLLHAQNVLNAITQDSAFLAAVHRTGKPFVANTDYFVSRYLVGEALGLRDFGENLPGLLTTDVNGQAMNVTADTLHDFGLVVLIAERSDDVRAWGEQIAPLAGQPLVIATGYSAAPLAEPYALAGAPDALAGVGGLLVGYRDAYTYRQMVDVALGLKPAFVPPTPTTPPVQPTAESTQAVVVPAEATGGATAQSVEGTSVPNPTAAEATALPTTEASTPVPPTASPEGPTAEPTQTLEPGQPTSVPVVVQAVIKSDGPINVRSGPGTTFAPISSLQPNDVVQVIGRSGDGKWIQVRLDDGTEGWVSAQLIDIQEPTIEPSPTREGASGIDPNAVVGLISDVSYFVPVSFQQPEGTPEVTAEATLEATPVVAPSPAPTAVALLALDTFAYRDERWYGMTLGLMAIIVVIALAALVNIARGLFRRGK